MPIHDVFLPVRRSRTLTYVLVAALLTGVYAAIPAWIEHSDLRSWNNMPSQFHGALSLALGWLLVFRTNTAYSRWWEARTLWGGLVNASRNMAIKFTSLGQLDRAALLHARELLIAFPLALKCHLRGERCDCLPESVQQLAGEAEHVPQRLAKQLYQLVAEAKRNGQLDGHDLRILDAEIRRCMDICGACERILKTRIVNSYRVFARQSVVLFLATLPWGICHDFQFWTIPLTIGTAYFMIGLETVAEHVEEPFGMDDDDLDTPALCRTIESSVNEVFATVG